jgi:signal transduction histidine kinase
VNSVFELESGSLDKQNVVLEAMLWPQPLPVHVDADLIKQALLNMVQNAAHAMPQGGHITLLVDRKGRDAILRVKDDGEGIPASQLDKIFNLYFTTKPTGSGIGLAMTYRIVQLHNGKIDVESTEGSGTTFTLCLPLSALEQRAPTFGPVLTHKPLNMPASPESTQSGT